MAVRDRPRAACRSPRRPNPTPCPATNLAPFGPPQDPPSCLPSLCCHCRLSVTSVSRPPRLTFSPTPGPATALPTAPTDLLPATLRLCARGPVLPLSGGRKALGLAQGPRPPPSAVRNACACACGPQISPTPAPLPWASATGQQASVGRVCVLHVPVPLGKVLAVSVNSETCQWGRWRGVVARTGGRVFIIQG